jgi:hypothetical protein
MSHRAHFNGETRYLYRGKWLETGQRKKNTSPSPSQTIFMQAATSTTSEKRRNVTIRAKDAAVFSGLLQ